MLSVYICQCMYLQVFFSILIASFSFGQAGPAITRLAAARGAAHYVFGLIERVGVPVS